MGKEEEIKLIKLLSEMITEHFLRQDLEFTLLENEEYIVHVLALFAKQTNTLQSILVLSEDNMNEEAAILFRTLINSYMLIIYLINDDINKSRLKEYKVQPLRNSLSFLHNVKYALMKRWFPTKEIHRFSKIDEMIKDREDALVREGFQFTKESLRALGISELAKRSKELSLIYYTFYVTTSLHEHSDVSVLKDYVYDFSQKDGKISFKLSTNFSNIDLGKLVLDMAKKFYIRTFLFINDHVKNNKQIHLDEHNIKYREIILLIAQLNDIDIDD